ncbi:hypothetical protein SGFS_002350 [Streptomyces graminofaciens]|uniref:AI-2E family transporter n=1 Tax=Streptomyces graminofaciens TaxID=68212 RepID=A0ABN5V7M6_9ACTN|nr:hypothetical protein [Streptomyces graminofaciens]BBC28944.1 hypothetical protein SGFS_002350 [Streptomyces graminofaciens]
MAQVRDSGGDRVFAGLSPTHRKVAAWSATVLLALGVAAFIVWVVVVLRAATVPFVLALLGTALLQPLMPWLMKRGASRALASGLTCAGLAVLVCGVLVGVIHSLTESAGKIADGLAEAGDKLADRFGPVGDKLQERSRRHVRHGRQSRQLSGVGAGVRTEPGDTGPRDPCPRPRPGLPLPARRDKSASDHQVEDALTWGSSDRFRIFSCGGVQL